MKKLLILLLTCLLAISISGIAFAFTVSESLKTQVATYSSTQLNASGQLTLAGDEAQLLDFALSPDFVNDRTTYLTTGTGLYRSSTYDSAFSQSSDWAAEIMEMPFKVVFGGNYQEDGAAALYSGNKVYISYNSGNNWSGESLGTNSEVKEVFTGPDFANFHRLYFIADDSLYARDLSGSSNWQVLAGDSAAKVTGFGSPSSSLSANTFYVVKGKKVFLTVDGGSSWSEYDAVAEIRKLVVADDNDDTGIPLILSGNSHLEAGNGSLNFYDMTLPSGISQIYDFNYITNGDQDYVLATDKGIYYTLDNGGYWQKVPYSTTDFSGVTNLAAITEGSTTSIFFILDDVLYRDLDASGNMQPYMTGITAAAKYAASGSAESKDIVALTGDTFDPSYYVSDATLWPDGDLNGQTMNFFMSVDGTHWEAVTPEEKHTFTNVGTQLKWKAELATADTAVTPVLKSVQVDFGFNTESSEPGAKCAGFTDVPAADSRCAAITYVKNQGIFSGYPDGTFKPDQAINRAETVKVVSEGFDLTMLPDPATNLGFSDVVLHSWYMPYLATAKDYDVIQGYPDGTFKPGDTVNYVELIKIFFISAGVDLPGAMGDVPWYTPYVDYATDNGYLVYSALDSGMKRGDVATLFYQHSQK